MCMKNLFSRMGRHTTRALCALAVCGLTWACTDEYELDDKKPEWLGSSIYQTLQTPEGYFQEGHTFNNFIKLVNDRAVNPDTTRLLSEVLNKTKSTTVFVADDNAWERFFNANKALPKSNPWHYATSYENLSTSQKLLLIHTALLGNAVVMENLASSDASSGSGTPVRGTFLRRYTDYVVTDSLTYMSGDDLPYSYSTVDNDYWARFRKTNGGNGLYLVLDSTRNMMIHFTDEYMKRDDHNVTDADFAIIANKQRQKGDVHIYSSKLMEKDVVAENGYINVTEDVIYPLPNMAEVLRTNGKTNIFSHMIDRFSFPHYNAGVSEYYRQNYPNLFKDNDSIFTKKYFSGKEFRNVIYDPDGKRFKDGNTLLKFDPGWNELRSTNGGDAHENMASMYVPSDEVLWTAFAENGKFWDLVKTYAADPYATVNKGDYDALYKKIDMIPLGTLQELLNVIMFPTFTESVPSKMTDLRNDAHEDIFTTDDLAHIDTCILANNGAIYIMDKVYGPAAFMSVASPAYISKTNNIMHWAINNGKVPANDQMHINYFAYLMAMKSTFTFFMPSDEAMLRYYDPVSFKSTRPRVIAFTFNGKDDTWNLEQKGGAYNLYELDTKTATILSTWKNEELSSADAVNRLKDILESHTIVHDGTNPIESENEFYVSKNGAGIKVTRDAQNNIIAVQGGYQLENENSGKVNGSRGSLSVAVTSDNTYFKENGRTYVIDDAPIIPPSRSVYSVLKDSLADGTKPYSKFMELAEVVNERIIRDCGLVNSTWSSTVQARILKRYNTFIEDKGVDNNVSFFNNYRYTVFVPTNDALTAAEAKGLPTWDSIEQDYLSSVTLDDNGDPLRDEQDHVKWNTPDDSIRIAAKITYLTNFIRGHFADNSIFADKGELSEAQGELVTSSYNSQTGVFVKLYASRVKGGSETTLYIRDDNGGSPIKIVGQKNIMARDVSCTRKPTGNTATTMNGIQIQGSSFAVIHQIDGVLNHVPLNADGTYGINWNSTSACKNYLKKFAIIR